MLKVPLVPGSDSFAAHGPGSLVDVETVLFDLASDPRQQRPLRDADVEARLLAAVERCMVRHDAPAEAFRRFGLRRPA